MSWLGSPGHSGGQTSVDQTRNAFLSPHSGSKEVFNPNAAAAVAGGEWTRGERGLSRDEVFDQALHGAKESMVAIRQLEEAAEQALRLARKRCSSEEESKRVAESLMSEFKRSRAWLG